MQKLLAVVFKNPRSLRRDIWISVEAPTYFKWFKELTQVEHQLDAILRQTRIKKSQLMMKAVTALHEKEEQPREGRQLMEKEITAMINEATMDDDCRHQQQQTQQGDPDMDLELYGYTNNTNNNNNSSTGGAQEEEEEEEEEEAAAITIIIIIITLCHSSRRKANRDVLPSAPPGSSSTFHFCWF
ncbi:hypothetical protein LOK49_LG04G03518 [Camellia lanceoleosa]|uniref:Uncharacterized protein n=1 Tax=Camellia lanceoleosa TaxID=1840588 RepID=A0ACC0HZ11_9ERIC|nr:hypothetical protein LOK49_LG04G03518 [Camellia lanceoleosa]